MVRVLRAQQVTRLTQLPTSATELLGLESATLIWHRIENEWTAKVPGLPAAVGLRPQGSLAFLWSF